MFPRVLKDNLPKGSFKAVQRSDNNTQELVTKKQTTAQAAIALARGDDQPKDLPLGIWRDAQKIVKGLSNDIKNEIGSGPSKDTLRLERVVRKSVHETSIVPAPTSRGKHLKIREFLQVLQRRRQSRIEERKLPIQLLPVAYLSWWRNLLLLIGARK